jgi:hypothetical protein
MDDVDTIPVADMVHIDTLISGVPDLWNFYTIGVRRIYFLCRTKGHNPQTLKGFIEYLTPLMGQATAVAGKPAFPDVTWVWYRPQERYMLVVSSRGVEFRVPKDTTPQGAMDIWRAFHLYFQDEKPSKTMASQRAERLPKAKKAPR